MSKKFCYAPKRYATVMKTLRSILAATLDGYCRIDDQGRLLDVNPAYCRQSGYPREQLLRMRVADLEASENNAAIAERIQRILETGSDQFETIHRRKDGSAWHVEVSATLHRATGKQLIVFLRDISERKQAEMALRESEARVQTKLNAILSPEGDIELLQLKDIIDIPALQSMMNDFYQVTGVLSAILDISGNVLIAVGWQDICNQISPRQSAAVCELQGKRHHSYARRGTRNIQVLPVQEQAVGCGDSAHGRRQACRQPVFRTVLL